MHISDNILTFIPQRSPFVMVDELVYVDETTCRSTFTIKPENIFCENNLFTEAGLIENIAQTGGAGNGYRTLAKNKPLNIGYLGGIKNLEIFMLPSIHDTLVTEVKTIHTILNVVIVKGEITSNEKKIAVCEMKIFISNTE